MSNYKEIITKAVKSKCKKRFSNNFSLTIEDEPNTILGCWIINHQFRGINNGENVTVNGSFDINVWYSYGQNKKTGVYASTFSYTDLLNCNLDIEPSDEIMVKALKQPTVSNVKIEGNQVIIDVEKELGVEVIGESIVKIDASLDPDDYVELLDDNEIEAVNSEYLD